ncbi:MAG: SLBB domain-containing protein [Actinomycetota bacterium]|nr:SLBB domain-containing protein [Actinomycetota bacterium]
MSTTHRAGPAAGALLGGHAVTWREHLDLRGPLPEHSGPRLLDEIAASGLTGHGGAHFPTARKLALVAQTPETIVIANGAEGEPASSKDRVLLQQSPHLVLDGLEIIARITGVRSTHLAAPGDLLDTVIDAAVHDRPGRRVKLHAAPEGFVTGQESAVAALVSGLPARPVTLTAPLMTRGITGRPTIVQNVETLAHIALIARFGASWFRSRGVPDEPGTRLVTISGAVAQPGVLEVRGGTALGDIIDRAGGLSQPVHAMLIGGYHGCWVPWTGRVAASALSAEGLSQYGASPGAGVLIALPAQRCGVQAAADIAAYLAGESAGQCGPCRNGLPTIASHLDDLAYGRATSDTVAQLYRFSDVVEGRGACRHPDGTARFIRSTLRTFSAEVAHHLAGRCTAHRNRTPPSTQRRTS